MIFPGNIEYLNFQSFIQIVKEALLDKLIWQNDVIDIVDEPPTPYLDKQRYIVSTTPTGVFAGHANEIAEYDGSEWRFIPVRAGMATFIQAKNEYYTFYNGAWISLNALIGSGNWATGLAFIV